MTDRWDEVQEDFQMLAKAEKRLALLNAGRAYERMMSQRLPDSDAITDAFVQIKMAIEINGVNPVGPKKRGPAPGSGGRKRRVVE